MIELHIDMLEKIKRSYEFVNKFGIRWGKMTNVSTHTQTICKVLDLVIPI